MKLFADRLQRAIELSMAALLALMTVLLFANVVARYLFHTGIAVSDEIARLSFVWLVFLGAIIAVRERGHIGIDMLVRIMPKWGKRLSLLITNGLVLYALWLFAYGSWVQTFVVGVRTVSPLTGLPVAVFAGAGLVSAVGMAVLYGLDTVRALMGTLSEDEMVQVQETPDHVDTQAPESKP
jgi:TRAP-type C4-dicarboxylate transport system permease small subunit